MKSSSAFLSGCSYLFGCEKRFKGIHGLFSSYTTPTHSMQANIFLQKLVCSMGLVVNFTVRAHCFCFQALLYVVALFVIINVVTASGIQ
jgi:hypothetical protein